MKTLWRPHEGQQTLALQVDDVFELLYGGARGGGKTDAGIVWMLLATTNPNFRGLVIRRNSEDLSDWVDRASQLYTNAKVSGKPPIFKFPNGATIRTGHLKDDQAYTKYQGHEYHRILIEELTQIPTEESYLKLISSCRSTVEGLEPKVFATANPGGKGHTWVKGRWNIGIKESNKAFKEDDGRYRMFVPATIDDNPTLMDNDPHYVAFLDNLPEPLRSAWRKGDWNVFAGQYFEQYHQNVHTISEEKAKKLGFKRSINHRYIGIDWGYSAPFCAIWIEVTPNDTVFCYREIYGKENHPSKWSEIINQLSKDEDITMALGDPSMWARNPMSWNSPDRPQYTDRSIANALIGPPERPLLPNLQPANNNRVNGWRNMAYLMDWNKKKRPRFYIIDGTCRNLSRTIPLMIRDEKNPEDIDTTLEDHALDACRYALTHTQVPQKPERVLTKLERDIEELMDPLPKDGWSYNF